MEKNAFTSSFDKCACVGDTIAAEVDGLRVEARLEFDHDSRPETHGFDPADEDYGDENAKICAAWKNDEWHYVGVVLSVSKNNVVLHKYAASCWGIDMNFPGSDNSYLTEVANELLSEAVGAGEDVLKTLCQD